MSFRLAAYGVCVEDGRVLLGRHVSSDGRSTWTLPGGGVEHAEDPVDTVVREVAEETGYDAVVERLLGVDSRVIPAAEARRGRGTRTSASSTACASPAAGFGQSGTAGSRRRSGPRSVMSQLCAGPRWSRSVWPWRGRCRRPAMSPPYPWAAWSGTERGTAPVREGSSVPHRTVGPPSSVAEGRLGFLPSRQVIWRATPVSCGHERRKHDVHP